MAAVLTVAACGGGLDDAGGEDVLAERIAADIPVMNGSTSTLPVRMFIGCALLDVACGWETFMDGSRHVLASDDALSDVFREVVPSSGTHGSYVALAEGRADLILTARLPSDDELDLAATNDVEFEIAPVALDGFVFLVNEANSVEELDLDQIRGIFSGSITTWAELGGGDRPIQPYQRNETSGSQVLMKSLVMGDIPMIDAPNMMLPSMMAPFDAISRDVDGIGFSVYFFATEMLANDEIRLVRIQGVEPDSSTIRSGEYPLITEVYGVLRASTPPDDTARLLRDWLSTDQGRAVVEASGYVPVS